MKQKYIFKFDEFENKLNNISPKKELGEIDIKAHNLITTISDYIDCESNLIINLTREEVERAMELTYEENSSYLFSMAIASDVKFTIKDVKSVRKLETKDLF